MATLPRDGGNCVNDMLFGMYKKEVGVCFHLVLWLCNLYIFYLIFLFVFMLAFEAFKM
jgi:hypothetical protein